MYSIRALIHRCPRIAPRTESREPGRINGNELFESDAKKLVVDFVLALFYEIVAVKSPLLRQILMASAHVCLPRPVNLNVSIRDTFLVFVIDVTLPEGSLLLIGARIFQGGARLQKISERAGILVLECFQSRAEDVENLIEVRVCTSTVLALFQIFGSVSS